jgi:hypothetical protein
MKYLALLLSMVLFSAVIEAQEHRWSLGASGLLGKSKFTYTDAPSEYTNKFAFGLGVFGQYDLAAHASLRMGLSYAHIQGGYMGQTPSFEFPGIPPIPGDKYEANFEYSNLVLPVELLIDLGREQGTGFYVVFGPAIQFRLSRKAERTTYISNTPFTTTISETDDRKVDLLGNLGMGYAFSLGSKYRAFVQPNLTTNIPGNVLDFFSQKKGDEFDNITTYLYGISFGVLLEI